jgi:hypothetical protein
MSDADRIYRIDVEGEPGNYHGVVIHNDTDQHLVLRTVYPTDGAARLAARTYLTEALNRGDLPLSPDRVMPVWSPHGKFGTARMGRLVRDDQGDLA